jgi:hypothetical protein
MMMNAGSGVLEMKRVLYSLSAVAAVGLVMTFIAHAAIVAGIEVPWVRGQGFLVGSVIAVFIPSILIGTWLTRHYPRKEGWKAALRGCPIWMRYLLNGLFAYAFLNFLLVMIDAPEQPHGWNSETIRFMTGHLLAFYGWSAAALYSAAKVWGTELRCPQGHEVRPLAQFCEQCGLPVRQPFQIN